MISFQISGAEQLIQRLTGFNPIAVAESETVRDIRENAAKGVDPQGSPFAPYTPQYKKRRARLGLKTDTVTLRVKSEDSMLDTLGASIDNVISVSDSKIKQATGIAKKRNFMGVSPGGIARMEGKFIDEFERMLK